MRELFRNNSPGALTRAQAVERAKEIEKAERAERRRMAEDLARRGRGEDTEIAHVARGELHVARGELVVPEALQTPEVLKALRRVAYENGMALERYRIGSEHNSINPKTGAPEFDPYIVPSPVRGGITVKTTAIPGVTPHYRNLLTDSAKTDFAIAGLHPDVRHDATRFVNTVKDRMGLPMIIPIQDGGMRTFEEQDALYAKGRTVPGKQVTKAPGGKSYHNYGLAFDAVPVGPDGRTLDYDVLKGDLGKEIGKIGNALGFKWGASFGDYPHFERSYGYSPEDLRQRMPSGGHLLNPRAPKN